VSPPQPFLASYRAPEAGSHGFFVPSFPCASLLPQHASCSRLPSLDVRPLLLYGLRSLFLSSCRTRFAFKGLAPSRLFLALPSPSACTTPRFSLPSVSKAAPLVNSSFLVQLFMIVRRSLPRRGSDLPPHRSILVHSPSPPDSDRFGRISGTYSRLPVIAKFLPPLLLPPAWCLVGSFFALLIPEKRVSLDPRLFFPSVSPFAPPFLPLGRLVRSSGRRVEFFSLGRPLQ